MSTSYYWIIRTPTGATLHDGNDRDDPRVHIGKTSARRDGVAFVWAAEDFHAVKEACARDPAKELIIDGYGKRLTGSEFLSILSICKDEFNLVGRRFS